MSKNSDNPRLINDQMKNTVMNKLAKSSNMADTSTNMYVPLFANDGKLVEEDYRRDYDDRNDEIENDPEIEEDKLDDDVGSYREKRNNVFKHHNSDVKESAAKEEKYEKRKEQSSSDKQPQNYNDPSSDDKKQEQCKADDPTTWSRQEMQIKKLDMLRKLGELSQRGVKISRNYNLEDDYETMKFEYDLHTGIRAKSNSVNWMSNMLIGIVKGVEMLNDNVNPFDIKFESTWSNKVTHDINDFQDVLGELYEKYTVPGKPMSPELKLFLMLSGSAISVQMYKGIAKASNTSEKINSDPDKIRELRRKAEDDFDGRSKLSSSSSSASDTSAKRKEKLMNEKLQSQHENAAKLAMDYHTIKHSEKEYDKIQKMAKGNNSGLNDALIMSESARSVKSSGTKESKSESRTSSQKKPKINLAEYKNEIIKNQKLLEAEKLLAGFEKEDRELRSAVKSKTSPRELKRAEDDNTNSNKKKNLQKSDSDTISIKSSSSASYSNPDIDNILRPIINSQKKLKEFSASTESSKSSSSSVSSSSSKRGIVIDSEEIRSSDRESRKIQIKKPASYDEPLTKEMISFGKKSNDSATTGSKRGRPRKEPLKIRVGSA